MKFLKKAALSLTIALAVLSSGPSQAMVGTIIVGSVPVAAAGIFIFAGSIVPARLTESGSLFKKMEQKKRKKVANIFEGIATLGLMLLDDGEQVSFTDLSSEQALQLGLTESELNSYNSELDQVNSVFSHVCSKLSEMQNPTAEDSAVIWGSVKDSLSTETFSAMQKILSQK